MEELRGFRYQTGEIAAMAEKMKKDRLAEADIDLLEELEVVCADLEEHGLYRLTGVPMDEAAVNLEQNPEFYGRVAFADHPAEDVPEAERYYLDFYHIEEPEKSYDEIYYG